MLGSMRSKAGGWVAKAFIVLLAASFAVWGVADVFSGRQSDVVAEVGTRQVSNYDYQTALSRHLQSLSRQFGQTLTPDQARQLGIDRQVLGQLLRDAALEAQADKLGLRISSDTVAQRIANDRRFQNASGQFNADQFRNLLRSNGITEQAFVLSEQQNLLRQSIGAGISRGVEVPGLLARVAYDHRNAQRDAKYFIVTGSTADVDEPSDSDLKAFYDSNQRLFAVPERRVFGVVQVTPELLAANIDVGEDQIADYYERTKHIYGTPEKRQVQQITFASDAEAQAAYDKITAGASFDDIAKERGLSETDLNLGEVTAKTFPDPTLSEAAFALALNEVSKPVKGKLSTALLRVTSITPGSQKTLDDVRDDVKEALQLDQARDEVLNVHDKIEDARAGGQTLAEIGKTLSLPVIETPALGRSGEDASGTAYSGISDAAAIVRAGFDSDVGVENDALNTGDDGFTWFEVRDVIAASTEPLADVRAQAVEAWKARQMRTRMLELGQKLVERARGGSSLDALAKEHNAEVRSQNGLKRNEGSETFPAAAVGALFAVPEDGYAYTLESDGLGVRLMKSSPVFSTPYSSSSDEAKTISQVLASGMTDDLYAQYLADLQADLGVSINEARLSTSGAR